MGHTPSKKVQLLSRQATEYFPNSLGDHQEFSGESFSAVVFVLEKNAGHFPQSLSYGRVMNTMTLDEANETCGSLDVALRSFVTS